MNLALFINPGDPLPIYRQIMRQIMDAIAGGRLKGGDRLMSHRELSEALVIAPLTVKKAYDELETLGYIESHRGRGTFVAQRMPRIAAATQTAALRNSARTFLSQAYLAGLGLPEVMVLLKDADRELAHPTSKPRKAQ